MPEPQELRYSSPAEEIYSHGGELANLTSPRRVFDDRELWEVLDRHGNIFLPMHIDLSGLPAEVPAADRQVQRVLTENPDLSLAQVEAQLGRAPASAPAAGAKWSPQDNDIRMAYLRARAIAALRKFDLGAASLAGYPLAQGPLTPPLVLFAQAAHHSGFVSFVPDEGVVRSVPLLAGSDQATYPQLALAIATDDFASRHGGGGRIRADAQTVRITCADGARLDIPIDRRGRLLVNWLRPRYGRPELIYDPPRTPAPASRPATEQDAAAIARRDEYGMLHISAGGLVAVCKLQEAIYQIRILKRAYQVKLGDALASDSLHELFRQADELYQQRVRQEAGRQYERLYDPSRPAGPTTLPDQESRIEKRIDEQIAAVGDPFVAQDASPRDRQAMKEYQQNVADLPRMLARQEAIVQAERGRLHAVVEGKICLVGSTATAAADFVPTPVENRMPGVQVHANVINTILGGCFVRAAPWWLDLAAIVLAGGLVAMVTGTRPVVTQAAPAALALAAGFVAFNALGVFAAWNYWLAMVAPLAAMLASFVAVTTWRQLTEERAKRHIRDMFAHALSPALVDRLIEDPSLAQLGGQRRELTCFFSDVQGFTPMAERLGEQQTVRLLNRYFDHMTEIVQNRRGGYLNKFLGDGIFVFFGAPVLQEDHAARATAAALECQEEVARLNVQLASEMGPQVHLVVRIGLATGEVMVGNCGSSQRMDYTAIGDTVNLASRLDGANKFFHTRILLARSTYEQSRPREWLARPLGQVQVVGKQEAVELYNLLGRRDGGPAQLARACDLFCEAMEKFRNMRFDQAGELFRGVLSLLPDDGPSKIYLDLCTSYRQTALPEDWQILRLTEK
jgi:class 3 adenylate cyclase